MKKVVSLSLLLLGLTSVHAQIKAITEKGDEVILYADGKWKYVNKDANPDSISVNNTFYKKDASATFLVKSKNEGFGIWIDPKKWSFTRSKAEEASEFEFAYKTSDEVAGIMVTEKTQIPIESMADIAFENAREASPDIEIEKKEYRTVNGKKMLCMKFSGSTHGIKITYLGYYYSTPKGTVQLLAFSTSANWEAMHPVIETMLNGLVDL